MSELSELSELSEVNEAIVGEEEDEELFLLVKALSGTKGADSLFFKDFSVEL